MSADSITPSGDTFHARAPEVQDHPHACTGGYVYLGYTATDENGEEVERVEALPCRRCTEAEQDSRSGS